MGAQEANLGQQLGNIETLLRDLSVQVNQLSAKQRERDEFWDEMRPIFKEVMGFATDKLEELDQRGYPAFGRESLRVFDRIVESYDEDDVRALGNNIVSIMDTVRKLTQPEVLAIANDATDVVHADDLKPTGMFGVMKATRDEDVQRGMAVFLGVLRQVGKGVAALSEEGGEDSQESPRKASKPARKAKSESAVGESIPRPKKKKKKARAKAEPVVVDGIAYNPGGFLIDPTLWTPDLAVAIAHNLGVKLEERHWVAIQWARQDYLTHGVSPNIRRVTQGSGVSTKELYGLFPRAPGMTVARVAGIPKPVGCI